VARTPIPRPEGVNSRWSTDFVQDQLANGRRFRVLTIIDDVTKECLAAVPDTSLSGKRVVREMDALIARRGRPDVIVSDNGTEFTSAAVLAFTQTAKLDWSLHRAGQADRERLRRELKGKDAGRMPQRASVLLDEPRPRRRRRRGGGFQHSAATLGDRLHDAGRLRREPETATGIGAAPH
jgi:transposase InsO family protein